MAGRRFTLYNSQLTLKLWPNAAVLSVACSAESCLTTGVAAGTIGTAFGMTGITVQKTES